VRGCGSRETPWDDHQRGLTLKGLLVFFSPHVLETATVFRVQAMNAAFALLLSPHCLWVLTQTLLFSTCQTFPAGPLALLAEAEYQSSSFYFLAALVASDFRSTF